MRYHGEEALGLVETLAIVPVIEATDKMLKAADVELVAFEAGGSTLCTVFVKGDVAACRSAVEAGAAAAEAIGTLTGKNVMPRPIKAISAIVNTHDIDAGSEGEEEEIPAGPTRALGMVETFGVLYLMEAADAMCKAADVELVGYENIYDGYVSALVRGDVGACKTAVAAGVKAIEDMGHEVYSHVTIARPHPGLEKIIRRYSTEGLID
jgi:microcompartment protein CcmL/EutN